MNSDIKPIMRLGVDFKSTNIQYKTHNLKRMQYNNLCDNIHQSKRNLSCVSNPSLSYGILFRENYLSYCGQMNNNMKEGFGVISEFIPNKKNDLKLNDPKYKLFEQQYIINELKSLAILKDTTIQLHDINDSYIHKDKLPIFYEYCIRLINRFVTWAYSYEDPQFHLYIGWFKSNRQTHEGIYSTNTTYQYQTFRDNTSVKRIKDVSFYGTYIGNYLEGFACIVQPNQTYYGCVKHSFPNGVGSVCHNNMIQSGIYLEGKKYSLNINSYPDNSTFQGYFQNNKKNGVCVDLLHKISEGSYKDKSIKGDATIISSCGSLFTGNVTDGIPNGYGYVINCQEKVSYKGNWKNGQYDGMGELVKYRNKSIMQGKGIFENGVLQP